MLLCPLDSSKYDSVRNLHYSHNKLLIPRQCRVCPCTTRAVCWIALCLTGSPLLDFITLTCGYTTQTQKPIHPTNYRLPIGFACFYMHFKSGQPTGGQAWRGGAGRAGLSSTRRLQIPALRMLQRIHRSFGEDGWCVCQPPSNFVNPRAIS